MNRAFFVIPPATLFAVFNSSLCFRRQREFRRRFGQEYKKFTPFSFPYTCQKGLSLRTITNIISDGSPILHESGFFRYSACNTLCRFQFVPLFQTAKRVSAAFRASVQKNHFVLFSVHLQGLSLRTITNIISDGSPILHESGFFRYSACNTLCRLQFVPLFQTAKRVSAAFWASVQKNHFVLFSVHLQKLSLRAITVKFSWLIRNGIKPLKLRLSYYRLGGKPRFFTFF